MTQEDIRDPFAVETDEDPFATPEDSRGGGNFEPAPFFDAIPGRLVALIPRKFEPEAKKRADRVEAGGKDTEERYTADMVVLDGGPISFWYNEKVEGSDQREPVEKVIDVLPRLFPGTWRTEGRVIGRLKKIDGGARPILLGRVRRVPQKDDAATQTIASIEAAWAAWEKRGKNGPRPKFSWDVVPDGLTEADKALARDWYRAAVADGFKA